MEKSSTRDFPKSAILGAKRYREYRDVLAVVLSDGKSYTHAEVKRELGRFLKRPIKEEVN